MMSIKRPRRLGRCFCSDMRTKAGRGPLGFGRRLGGEAGAAAGPRAMKGGRRRQDPGSGSVKTGGSLPTGDGRQNPAERREGHDDIDGAESNTLG